MKKRKICVITGTRADYSQLYPILREIKSQGRCQLVLLAVGMHFSKQHGNSVRQIEADGFKIDYRVTPDKNMAMDTAKYAINYARIFTKERPDLIFLFGDRSEMLAAATIAVYLNIPVVHYHGGDISGNIDDSVRHAITKLSHYHFVSNPASGQRLKRLGERPDRIFMVGHTAWDNIKENLVPAKLLRIKYGLKPGEKFLLVLQHSIVTDEESAAAQVSETLAAVGRLGLKAIVIFPNSDSGGEKIIMVIKQYQRFPLIQIHKNLPAFDYLSLMPLAAALVGNSSSGIVEAGFFGLPVVNIGDRQKGRLHGRNVVNVPPNREKIFMAVSRAVQTGRLSAQRVRHPYSVPGSPAKRIAGLLASLELSKKIMEKQITY